MSGWIQLLDYITLTAHGGAEVTRWPNFSKSTKILGFLLRLYFSQFFLDSGFWNLEHRLGRGQQQGELFGKYCFTQDFKFFEDEISFSLEYTALATGSPTPQSNRTAIEQEALKGRKSKSLGLSSLSPRAWADLVDRLEEGGLEWDQFYRWWRWWGWQ